MTTEEIKKYVHSVIHAHFTDYTAVTGEMTTSPGGDGRFFGKVFAVRYDGLPVGDNIYLAIGETEKKRQIIRFGDSECLTPSETELDLILGKELHIEL